MDVLVLKTIVWQENNKPESKKQKLSTVGPYLAGHLG